jgi:hypothetical protein
MLTDTSAQKTLYSESALLPATGEKVACPNCSRLHDAGDRICQYCGAAVFSLKTSKFDSTVLTRVERTKRIGSASLDLRKPITFDIGLERFVLPIADSLIIGRTTPLPEQQPDVDLEPYMAQRNGVSRLHLKITRSHDLIYVTDLRSMNGTRLNGYRLVPHQERILRSGDELIVGRLKVSVSF